KESQGLLELVKVFSEEILNEDGSLNRKMLAQKAFSSKENTELLNKTIFPFIINLVEKEIIGQEKVLLDAPTLFESGINSMCYKTVAVLADVDTRLARIMKRDKIDKDSAMLRINAGKNDEFYKQNADYILYNNGNLDELVFNFETLLRSF
ncbi:MAG: dephospho-CoA kinase, partial [Clostridia bacterium]|nr:dephospho-CoA kinase [Clostridia bacterium]